MFFNNSHVFYLQLNSSAFWRFNALFCISICFHHVAFVTKATRNTDKWAYQRRIFDVLTGQRADCSTIWIRWIRTAIFLSCLWMINNMKYLQNTTIRNKQSKFLALPSTKVKTAKDKISEKSSLLWDFMLNCSHWKIWMSLYIL